MKRNIMPLIFSLIFCGCVNFNKTVHFETLDKIGELKIKSNEKVSFEDEVYYRVDSVPEFHKVHFKKLSEKIDTTLHNSCPDCLSIKLCVLFNDNGDFYKIGLTFPCYEEVCNKEILEELNKLPFKNIYTESTKNKVKSFYFVSIRLIN